MTPEQSFALLTEIADLRIRVERAEQMVRQALLERDEAQQALQEQLSKG